MIKKEKIKYILFIALIYIFIFQELLEKNFLIMQYFDEFYAFLFVPVLFFKILKNIIGKEKLYLSKDLKKQALLILIIIIIGIISSISSNLQSTKAILYDMIIFMKFPLAYWCTTIIFDDNFIYKYSQKINRHISFITFIFFVMTIINYSFNIFEMRYRYGIPANQLFYFHPGKLVVVCVFLFILNVLTSKKKLGLTNILLLFIISSTLRSKGIGFCIIAIILLIYIKNKNKKISFSKIGLISCIAIFAVYDQISYYYIDEINSPRMILNNKSMEIAKRYAPLGSGFSTFGSNGSALFYSPLYRYYGLNLVYGFSNNDYQYISDTFWPMILAQFGYFGLILYVMYVIILFKTIQSINIKYNKNIYIAKLLCLGYLIISSTSESAFVNPMAVTLALIMGIKDSKYNDNKEVQE